MGCLNSSQIFGLRNCLAYTLPAGMVRPGESLPEEYSLPTEPGGFVEVMLSEI